MNRYKVYLIAYVNAETKTDAIDRVDEGLDVVDERIVYDIEGAELLTNDN